MSKVATLPQQKNPLKMEGESEERKGGGRYVWVVVSWTQELEPRALHSQTSAFIITELESLPVQIM